MTVHLFHEFPADEQEDVKAACARFGFIPLDFEITDEDAYPVGPAAIHREVRVLRSINGKMSLYDAGPGTAWTVAFETELQAGAFGRP
jgi:hypothetical protein